MLHNINMRNFPRSKIRLPTLSRLMRHTLNGSDQMESFWIRSWAHGQYRFKASMLHHRHHRRRRSLIASFYQGEEMTVTTTLLAPFFFFFRTHLPRIATSESCLPVSLENLTV